MKHLIGAIGAAFLTGCSTVVPLSLEFPEAPPSLMQSCPKLQTVNSTERQLSDVLQVVTKNYAEYHQCAAQVSGWISWYNTNKTINEKFKEVKLEK